MRAILIVMLVITPSMLVPGMTPDAKQTVALVALFAPRDPAHPDASPLRELKALPSTTRAVTTNHASSTNRSTRQPGWIPLANPRRKALSPARP